MDDILQQNLYRDFKVFYELNENRRNKKNGPIERNKPIKIDGKLKCNSCKLFYDSDIMMKRTMRSQSVKVCPGCYDRLEGNDDTL